MLGGCGVIRFVLDMQWLLVGKAEQLHTKLLHLQQEVRKDTSPSVQLRRKSSCSKNSEVAGSSGLHQTTVGFTVGPPEKVGCTG